MSNFSKNLLSAMLGLIGLFSFFFPIVFALLFLFKAIDTTNWDKDTASSLIIGAFFSFWIIAGLCLAGINEILSKNKASQEDQE